MTLEQLKRANNAQAETIKACWYRESQLKRQVEALRRENEYLRTIRDDDTPKVSRAILQAEQFFKEPDQ